MRHFHVPGVGGVVASFRSYSLTVQVSKDPDSFGKGNIQGVIQEGGNPFEGPRQRGYPNPPLRRSHATMLFDKAAREVMVGELVGLLQKLIARAKRKKKRLAPVIGIGCPGRVGEDAQSGCVGGDDDEVGALAGSE